MWGRGGDGGRQREMRQVAVLNRMVRLGFIEKGKCRGLKKIRELATWMEEEGCRSSTWCKWDIRRVYRFLNSWNIKRIVVRDPGELYETQTSMSLNKVVMDHSHTHLLIGCFGATRAEWCSCNRNCIAHKRYNICKSLCSFINAVVAISPLSPGQNIIK